MLRTFVSISYSSSSRVLLKQCSKAVVSQRHIQSAGIEEFNITRVYCDDEGRTRFGDFRIKLQPSGPIGSLSNLIPTEGVMVRSTPANYDYDWHPTPRRQFVVNLDAAVDIEVSSGERRVVPRGGIFLLEDTKGKLFCLGEGHRSRAVDDRPRTSLFIPVPDCFQVEDC